MPVRPPGSTGSVPALPAEPRRSDTPAGAGPTPAGRLGEGFDPPEVSTVTGRRLALTPEVTPAPGVLTQQAYQREFVRLSQNPDTAAVLQAAGITDAAGLMRFGQQLLRLSSRGASARPGDVDLSALRARVPERALVDVLVGMAQCFPNANAAPLTDPDVALLIARGTPVDVAITASRTLHVVETGAAVAGGSIEAWRTLSPDQQETLKQAGRLAKAGQGREALDLLARSSKEFGRSPEFRTLAAQAAGLAAQALPDGVVKRLLSQPSLVAALLEPETVGDFKALLQGELQGPVRRLLLHDALRDGTIDVVCQDPQVAEALQRAGLNADLLKSAGRAAGPLLAAADAIRVKDWPAALEAFRQAVASGAYVSVELVGRMAQRLPEGLARTLLSNPAVLYQVLTNRSAQDALVALCTGDGPARVEAFGTLLRDRALRYSVLGAAAGDPAVVERLAVLGLTTQDLLDSGEAAVHLFDAAQAVARKDVGTALRELRDAFIAAPGITGRLVDVAIDHLPDAALAPLTALGITREDLKAGKGAAPALWAAGQYLSQRPPNVELALEALIAVVDLAPAVAGKLADAAFGLLPPNVQHQLEALGITRTELRESVRAAPGLIRAAKAFAAGQTREGLVQLRDAGAQAPQIIERSVAALAAKLPPGAAREVLLHPPLVRTLLTDASLHGALADLLSGTAEGAKRGLVAIGQNGSARTAAADALWKSDALRAGFEKLGFVSAADLAGAGRAFYSAIQVHDYAAAGQYGLAVQSFFDLTQDLPDAVTQRLARSLTETLHLPPGLADVVLHGGHAFSDPEIRRAFADAVSAWKAGDTKGFLRDLGRTGELLAVRQPSAATAFLNFMGNLPGGVGRFFQDPVLNEGLVRSGSVGEVFQAAQKLVDGDFEGAFRDMAESVGKLIGYGERLRIAGRQLPLGREGLELMARLAKQFVAALPEKVKLKIETKAAELAARAGGAAIPGGSLIAAAADGYDVYKELLRVPVDWIAVALKSSEVALDLAGTVGLGPVVAPARLVVGAVDTLHDLKRFVDDLEGFRRSFVFGPAPPP